MTRKRRLAVLKDINGIRHRLCFGCSLFLPLDSFRPKQSRCPSCQRAAAKRRYEKIKREGGARLERVRENGRTAYHRHKDVNREERKQRRRFLYHQNKEAHKASRQAWQHDNREKTRETNRRYREKHREKRNERNRKYAKRMRESDPERYKENRKKYAKKLSASHSAYTKRRYKKDDVFKLQTLLRSQATRFLRKGYRGDLRRAGSFVRDLGCSLKAFWSHIESLFLPGMTRDNYGEWHLDHIFPLSRADLTDRVQFLAVVNYRNYQPLWKAVNLRKNSVVTKEAKSLFDQLCDEFRGVV